MAKHGYSQRSVSEVKRLQRSLEERERKESNLQRGSRNFVDVLGAWSTMTKKIVTEGYAVLIPFTDLESAKLAAKEVKYCVELVKYKLIKKGKIVRLETEVLEP